MTDNPDDLFTAFFTTAHSTTTVPISVYQAQQRELDALKEQLASQQSSSEAIERMLRDDFDNELAKLERQIKQLRDSEDLEFSGMKENEELSKQVDSLRKELEYHRDMEDQQQTVIEEMREQIRLSLDDDAHLEEKIAELEEVLQREREENANLRQADRGEIGPLLDHLEEQVDSLERTVSELQGKLEQEQENNQTLAQSIVELTLKNQQLERELTAAHRSTPSLVRAPHTAAPPAPAASTPSVEHHDEPAPPEYREVD